MTGAAAAEIEAALGLAVELAEAAGAIIRSHFRQRIEVFDKPDATPVTVADRDAETAMRRLIGARFPAHGVIGEEHGAERPGAELVWVLDPIDGTKSFISGVPLFGTLIALLHQGRPVLGVLDQPILRERWIGRRGAPSTHNALPIRTRLCADLAAATVFSTDPALFRDEEAERFERIRAGAKLVRYGADCYAYGLVALGCIDAVVESGLKPHDFCALVPIIEGAGGIVTDWAGRAPGLDADGRILACGDHRLHAALLGLLR